MESEDSGVHELERASPAIGRAVHAAEEFQEPRLAEITSSSSDCCHHVLFAMIGHISHLGRGSTNQDFGICCAHSGSSGKTSRICQGRGNVGTCTGRTASGEALIPLAPNAESDILHLTNIRYVGVVVGCRVRAQ